MVDDPSILAKYVIHRSDKLGEGSYGAVYRVTDRKTQGDFAGKLVIKNAAKPESIQQLFEEVAVLRKIQHPHIVSCHDMVETPHAVFIVMELIHGGDLFAMISKLKSYTENTAARLMQKLLLAVEYMHDNSVCHRDLKPENIMLARKISTMKIDPAIHHDLLSDIKVTDFGFATWCHAPLKKCCGTPYYIAPEILKFGLYKSGPPYDHQCDVWSSGVIAYVLLGGFPPFQGQGKSELFKRIVDGKVRFPHSSPFDRVSDLGKAFIKSLLTVDPKQRPTASEALKHEWIVKATKEVEEAGKLPSLPGVAAKIRVTAKEAFRAAVFGAEASNRLAYIKSCSKLGVKPNSAVVSEMEGREGEDERDELILSKNYVGTQRGLLALVELLKSKKTLKKLAMNDNELDNTSLDSLVQTLERHPSVTHIDLSGNPLSKTGAKKLIQLLLKNPNITRLDLQNTAIHRDKVEAIGKLLERNKQLFREAQAKAIHAKGVAAAAKTAAGATTLPPSTAGTPALKTGTAAKPTHSAADTHLPAIYA